jgi:hypothetical protein
MVFNSPLTLHSDQQIHHFILEFGVSESKLLDKFRQMQYWLITRGATDIQQYINKNIKALGTIMGL